MECYLTPEKEKKIRAMVDAAAIAPDKGHFCSVLLSEVDRLRYINAFTFNALKQIMAISSKTLGAHPKGIEFLEE